MYKRIYTGSCFALLTIYSSCLLAAASLGDMASTLVAGGSVLSKLIWAVCIVVGIAMIAASFTQLQIHRRNPKLVPLFTPILYLILGIASIALPYLGQTKGFLSQGIQGVKSSAATSNQNVDPNDIDAPIN